MNNHVNNENEQNPQPSHLHVSDKNTRSGQEIHPSGDKEWFIRKTFTTDPKKGCELLFKHYYLPLCSHAVRFVYSKQIAQDLVGEVFYVFWQKQLHTQIHTSFRAYLFTAVRQRALTYVRWELGKDSMAEDITSLQQASTNLSPEQVLQYDELYLSIEKAIQTIPPQSQKVFLLNRFEGKKNREIASELQISLKTVESHLTKALHILRKAVKEEWLILLLWLFHPMV